MSKAERTRARGARVSGGTGVCKGLGYGRAPEGALWALGARGGVVRLPGPPPSLRVPRGAHRGASGYRRTAPPADPMTVGAAVHNERLFRIFKVLFCPQLTDRCQQLYPAWHSQVFISFQNITSFFRYRFSGTVSKNNGTVIESLNANG